MLCKSECWTTTLSRSKGSPVEKTVPRCTCVHVCVSSNSHWHEAGAQWEHTFTGEQLSTKVPPLLLSFITPSSIYLEQICLPCFKKSSICNHLDLFSPRVYWLVHSTMLQFLWRADVCSAWADSTGKPASEEVWTVQNETSSRLPVELILSNVKIFRKMYSRFITLDIPVINVP